MEAAQAIMTFIQDVTSTQDLVITPATRIEEDLGVTGQDAVDLLLAIAARYHVDLRHLRWDKYFYSEPHLGNFLMGYRPRELFTVGDILQAVERGCFGPEYS
ncbi:DUF1493 family protein [Hymenobacter persicinus]|uniref:DUF1493 family protein n=1 Tax=Hymenobacter persicinus TaxID=2025506 RepID=A0A4Q5LDN3_9BACT|nr:DUF1493 family protein [Hymenobacter persicinus]RYU81833.1 DUF1493 family protein [Hymenobacter persicinus]